MSQAIYTASAETFDAALGSLAEILTLAAAREDAASLLDAKLAPDMLPFSTQIRLVCFHANNGTARLMGQEPPGRPAQGDADFASLQALVAETRQKLSALTAENFAGAETRRIIVPLQPPEVLDIDGVNYLHRWVVPNFYFHFVTAYDILRANGLAIGKRNYMSHLAGFMRQSA